MQNLKKLVLVGGFMAVLALTGCKSSESSSSDRSEGRAIDDKNITAQVEERLKNEPAFKFNEVSVQTFEGTVQLSGFADSAEQKSRAGELAQKVEGVTHVVNNITLKTTLTPTGN